MGFCRACNLHGTGHYCGECRQPLQAEPMQQHRRTPSLPVILTLCVAGLMFGAGTFLALNRLGLLSSPSPSPAPVASTSTEVPSVEPSTPTAASSSPHTSTSAATDTGAPARTELATLREQGVAALPLDGRWVAQLASKYEGVVDPAQTAADGGHTFRAADILNEHHTIRGRFGDGVRLVGGTDIGKRSTRPQAVWTTVLDLGADTTRAQVKAWCAKQFGLSGKALDNVCLAREAVPPHD